MSDADARPTVLSVGTLTKLHGVRGELKLRAEPDMVEFLRAAADEALPVTLRMVERGDEYEVTLASVRGHHSAAIVAIDGVERREEAEAYRGALVCVPRELLPEPDEDEYFLADLQGCAAHDSATGDRIGVVTRAESLPANVVLTVRLDAGGSDLLVPLIDDAVPAVDVDARRIDIDCAFLGVGEPDEAPDA
ncbi:MAG: rimM [Thermoleophilia bacterium]|nr:rimM [Thermoleophilia bacterium]